VTELHFRPFEPTDRAFCLALFDDNTPEFFAAGERGVLERFLDRAGPNFFVASFKGDDVAACGLGDEGQGRGRIQWFMVTPNAQGQGIGRGVMEEMRRVATERGVTLIDISASHLSEPFYRRYGAETVSRQDHGWGPDMHRVDMIWRLEGAV